MSTASWVLELSASRFSAMVAMRSLRSQVNVVPAQGRKSSRTYAAKLDAFNKIPSILRSPASTVVPMMSPV